MRCRIIQTALQLPHHSPPNQGLQQGHPLNVCARACVCVCLWEDICL